MAAFDYIRDPDAISRRSFELIAAEADLARFPVDIRPVAERLIHTSGMIDVADDLAWSDSAGQVCRDVLKAGAPVLCDVTMVASGLSRAHLDVSGRVHVAVTQDGANIIALRDGMTRSAAGFDCLANRLKGSIVVIGNAPTALFRVLELAGDPAMRPAAILGFPVGFVGAAESKQALADNCDTIPYITLAGRRGGSAMAAAAVNALLRETNAP
ncbi:MAG: precorrin-8X methylmutase [Alphaproteobacteria bacterium]